MLSSFAPPATAASGSKHPTRHSKSKSKRAAKKTAHRRGQQAMNPERVREIQAALIRENYLQGQANGAWDQRSKEAMQRYQAANGWQTKMIPDSRALIKLGLGPDRANLINPDTAAVASFIPGGGSKSAQPEQ